ncbi:MAG: InlB B-repeat-containing protein [Faecalibacterium prausnitzii]
MKQGKLIRRAVSAALAGCMMFTLSAPALAESTDALMQLNISGNRAVSVLDAENVAEEIKINNNVIDPADYENIVVTPGNYTFHYDPVQKILTSTNTTKTINTITIEVPDDVDVVLDGKENIAVHNLTINRAHDVTISSDNYSAIGRRAVITCTGKVTINAPEGTYAIGYTSNADGTLIIHRANEVEIDASGSSRVLSGYGKADITCDGPVTIHGEKDGGSVLANAGNFTYHRTDSADYVYFTSEDGEEGAIDAGVTPIEANARYSYLRIEEKQDAHLKVNNGTATAGDTTSGELDSFNGQKVTVTAQIDETDERKFDGWEVVNAPAGFTISAEKLAQKEFSFIMPTGNVELTAHHSNKLEVSGGTAKVNGNSNADFARPGAAVTVTAGSPEDYQFDHWEVSGGNIGKTEEELKVSPLSFTMPDAAVKLTAVYKAAVKVSNGTAQTDNTTGETVYALEGASVTVTGHDSNASFSKLVGWKLKKGSLTAIIDADGNSLNVTVDAENNYLLDASGAKIKNETFMFTMSDKPVELSAVYSIPAIAMSLPVIVEGGTINGTQDSFVRVKAGEKVTIKADAPAENMQFHHWKVEEGTSADFGVTVGTLGSDTEQGTEEIAFIMPRGAVRLTAQWSATPATRPDPDQPLDEDFGVDTPQPKPEPEEPEEPEAPAESAAGAIAAVAIGGAAVWGGYEITTRAILKNLLPADAAIPKTQGQLAELLWQNAGCPQPTVAQATDAAAAARWCVEQGYLEEDFAPEKYVPKYKVIRILKQAKSAT